jgi:hypothetical protein
MVASNHLLALAATLSGAIPLVLADTLVEAAKLPDIVVYQAAAAKRSNTVDPYAGWTCNPGYPLTGIPSNPSCTQNNCWRYVSSSHLPSHAPLVLTLNPAPSLTPARVLPAS